MEDDGLSFDFEEALQSAPAQQPAPARTVSPYVQGSGAPGAAQAMAVASYNPSTSGRHFRQASNWWSLSPTSCLQTRTDTPWPACRPCARTGSRACA